MTGEEHFMCDLGSLGISSGTRGVTEHIHRLRFGISQYNLWMSFAMLHYILHGIDLQAHSSSLFSLFLSDLIKHDQVLQRGSPLLLQLQQLLELVLLNAHGGHLCLVNHEGQSVWAETVEKGYDGNIVSEASQICNGPLLSVLAEYAKEAPGGIFCLDLRLETQSLSSYDMLSNSYNINKRE